MRRAAAILFLLATAAVAQGPQSSIARHIGWGAAVPAKCSPTTGDVFFKTGAPIGVYYCSAPDTYTQLGAGGIGDMLASDYFGSGAGAPANPCTVAGAQYWNTTPAPDTVYVCPSVGANWLGPFALASDLPTNPITSDAVIGDNLPAFGDGGARKIKAGTRTGNTTHVATAIVGAKTTGNYPQWDADGNLTDGGVPGGLVNAPNYSQSFVAQTSVALTHNLGTPNLVTACYDNSTPEQVVLPSNVQIAAAAPYAVTVTFGTAQTGRCVVSGGGGGYGVAGAYGAGWDANTSAPTKDAVYDKIETLAPNNVHVLTTQSETGLSDESSLGGMADNSIVAVDVAAAVATPRAAGYADVVAIFGGGTCSGYLKSDGTCDTPAGAGDVTDIGDCSSGACFTTAGIGTALVFKNATSGQVTLQTVTGALGTRVISLPAETGTVLTTASSAGSFPTLNQNTSGTAAGLAAAYIDWAAGSGGASILNKPTLYNQTIQDEGSGLTQRAILNFAGAGVTCADDTTKTTCTVTSGGIATMATGSGAPSAACSVPSGSNIAFYWDTTARNLYYCANNTGPVWQKFVTDGAGSGKTGAAEWLGKTSGGAGFTVNDVAGTSILYILPATNGAANQILYDTGAATCPDVETPPTSCHQLAWVTMDAASSANTIVRRNASNEVIAANTVGTGKTPLATDGSAANLTNFPTLNQNTSGTAANLSGTPALPNGTTATTQAAGDNSTKLATTAYADRMLPLAGGTLTGQLVTSNLGVEFGESDTNPTCAAGNYNIFADLSETKLKKCVNGSVTDLDTASGSTAFGDITTGTNANALHVGTGGSLDATGTGTITATGVIAGADPADAGVVRGSNNAVLIAAEAATPGTDLTITPNTSDEWESNVPIRAPEFRTPAGATAGLLGLVQGTACTPETNEVCVYAPASVTAYGIALPGTVGTTGLVKVSVSGSVATLSFAAGAAGDVGLGNVTNDAQTKASVVPNTWTQYQIPYASNTNVLGTMGTDFIFGSTAHVLAAGSAGILDLSAASPTAGLKIPVAAGAAPTVDGQVAVDSTAHTFKYGSNGSSKTAMATDTAVADSQLPAKQKVWSRDFAIDAPVTGDSGKAQFYLPFAATVTSISCSVGAATSATINLEERAVATPNTAGTAVLTSDLVCDTDSASSTTFSNAGLAADVPIALTITAVSGTPGVVRVHVKGTID